jgi:hypothetical protein
MASMWDDWMKQAGGGLATSLGPKALGAIGMVPESAQGAAAFGILPALLGPSALFGFAAPMVMKQSMQGSAAPTATGSPTQRVDMPKSLYGGMPSGGVGDAPPTASLPMMVSAPMPTIPTAEAVPPMPRSRSAMPAAPAAAPMPLPSAAPAPSVREGFMQRLLGGPNYQSNNMPVVMSPQGPMASGGFLPQSVNWGDPESAADFFRADQAARQLGLLG